MSSHRSSDSGRKSSRKTTTAPASSSYGQGQGYGSTQYNDGPATTSQQYSHRPSSSTSTPQPYYTDSLSQPSWNSSTGSQGGMSYNDPRSTEVASSRRQVAKYAQDHPGTTQLPSAYRTDYQAELANFDQRYQGQSSTGTQPYCSTSTYAPTLDLDFPPSQSQSQSQSQSRRDDRRGSSSASGSKHHSSSSRRHK
ncbi:uncharacterized protein CCOS01_14407 [Colletotrichum costaricense]|uniref:Uncharacterized protein n=1 Tax=Colletotrichum costaricense TaxID=1209916 RepID=A0AAJ0DUS4_9PEZI|nr:uncharacterized protein CCOS01_14407 [Colletotrichum costaricense]KAK1513465.1 hypothetical protein CCOS01_14407 [Colletotrichum costaricense]